jgi:hypothetical protein
VNFAWSHTLVRVLTPRKVVIAVQARLIGPVLFALTVCAVALAAAPAGAAPASLVDDAAADFAAATPGTSTWVTEPGSVRLRPTVLSEGFDDLGPDLPATLESVAWNPPAGSATVGSGSLTVDGVRVHPPAATQTAPEALEFRATFASSALQHVGFGNTLEGAPWAIFSTGDDGTGLSVRTQAPSEAEEDPIATDPLVPHVYRIEWAPTEVRYLVDDVVVATHEIAIATPMRPIASDFAAGSDAIKIDWLGMGAYSTPGVFESRVHDAGDQRAVWGDLTATATGGGTVTFETRSGKVPTPDATWSDWQPTGTAGAIASPIGRYIQYRATLSDTNGISPSLDRVEIGYEVDNVLPVAAIDDVTVAGDTATVSFSSADQDVDRLECKVGAAATFMTCTSPRDFAGLASGSYTVFVRAVDDAGNVGAAVEREFTVDLDAPATVIDDVVVAGAVASVHFSSAAGDVDRFECGLGPDVANVVFATCSSPNEFPGLASGSYKVFVRAVDEAGNVGAPVERQFTVDLDAPAAVIDGVTVAGGTATVRFSSADLDLDRLECRLGAAATFATCTSPKEFAGLASGSYTVFVRAIDTAGNVSPVVERPFTVPDPPVSGGGQNTTPPTGTDPPVVAPDETAPAVVLLTRSARASATGLVTLRVSCPDSELRCRMTVRLTRGRARSRPKRVNVDGGERAKVRLRLPSALRSLLLARDGLKVTAVITARDLAGNLKTVKRKITLRPPSA